MNMQGPPERIDFTGLALMRRTSRDTGSTRILASSKATTPISGSAPAGAKITRVTVSEPMKLMRANTYAYSPVSPFASS
jgi:hypothetical protein